MFNRKNQQTMEKQEFTEKQINQITKIFQE